MTRRTRDLPPLPWQQPSPAQRAYEDQTLAATRTLPNALTVVTVHADPDTPCSWCDCTRAEAAVMHRAGAPCNDICPHPAQWVVDIAANRNVIERLPLCRHHYGPAAAWLREDLESGGGLSRVETFVYDDFDEPAGGAA